MVRLRERRGYVVIEALGRRFEWTVEPRYWRNPLVAVAVWLAAPVALAVVGQQGWLPTQGWLTTLVFANVLATVSVPYALRAVGTGRMDFGPHFFVALSGYTAAIVSRGQVGPLGSLAASVAVATAVALLLSPTVVISRGIYFTLITFILPFIMLEVAYWRSDIFGAETGIPGVPRLFTGLDPVVAELQYFYLSAAVVLAYLFVVDKVLRSKYGLMMGVINEDEDVAELYGIDTKRLKVAVFVSTSAMMAVAGWLLAHYYGSFTGPLYLSPEFLILIFLGLVIGGKGAVYGALIGAYFAAVIREVTRILFGEFSTLAFFGISLALLFLLPEGLWGLYRRRRYREYVPTVKIRRKL